MPGPGQKPSAKNKKTKKKGFFDRIPGSKIASQTAKDLGNIAKNAPGGIYVQTKAFGKDIAKGDYKNIGGIPIPTGKETRKVWREAGKSTKTTLQHPLRNPGYTLITALGVAAPGAKGIQSGVRGGRAVGAGARAAREQSRVAGRNMVNKTVAFKAPLEKPPKIRSEIARSWRESKPSKVPTRTLILKGKTKEGQLSLEGLDGKKVEIPASRVITTRAAQKSLDKIRAKFPAWQEKKVNKELARDKDYADRLHEQDPLGVKDTAKAIKKGKLGTKGYKDQPLKTKARSVVADTNATVRGLRLYRFGYGPPNAGGAIATNLIQQGPRGLARSIKEERATRGAFGADILPGKKSSDTARAIDRLSGETLSEAMMDAGPGGIPSAAMRGVGTSISKFVDRRPRARSWHHEAGLEEYSVAQRPDLIAKAKAGDPKALRDVIQISRRAEEAAIKFTRSKPLKGQKESAVSQIDRILAENVFLYKWITGSTKYTGHMVKEHPTLTAALGQLGQQAPHISDVLPEYPEFMERYLPVGEREGMPLVSNMQAASLWDMPGEMATLLGKSITEDPLEATEQLNPFQHALVVALTGHDRFRDQRLPEDRQSPMDRLRFATETELRSIPYNKLAPESIGGRMGTYDQSERLMPMSNWDIILQHILGGPYPVRVNPQTAKKMSRQEKKRKKK